MRIIVTKCFPCIITSLNIIPAHETAKFLLSIILSVLNKNMANVLISISGKFAHIAKFFIAQVFTLLGGHLPQLF